MLARPSRLRLIVVAMAFGGVLLPAARASAAEFYYVLIFGSQGHPKQLRYSHTWATFVKATGEGPDPNNYTLQHHTISWMPATGVVHVLDPRPERGVNLDVPGTMKWVQETRQTATVWGPFRVGPIIWEKSLRIHQIINSGQVQYRAISNAQNLLISDCIHAVAAVDPVFGRNHYPLIRIGKPASRYIARQIMTRSVYDQTQNDNAWLIPRLGFDAYPLTLVPPSAMAR